MKTTPISSPHALNQPNSNPNSASDARARAIAKLTPQQVSTPVANQTQIAPEELSAIMPGQPIVDEPKQDSPAPEATEQKSEPSVSSQMAVLARKERALRAQKQQQEQALKSREEALKAREAELEAKYSQQQVDLNEYVPKSRLKENALDVLTESGVSYEDLTQQIINQPVRNPRYEAYINKLETKLQEMETKFQNQEKAQAQAQDDARQAAVKQIATDVTKMVKGQSERFELINKTKAEKEVVALIERVYDEEGWVMDNEEAAELVEKEIEERISKLVEAKKIKSRFGSAPEPKQAQTQQPSPSKQPQPMKTLTNANSSSRKLSARERAVLAFKGELKS